jgi:hypothetical protein
MCNAGVHVRDIERTEEGFELAKGTTFFGWGGELLRQCAPVAACDWGRCTATPAY